MFLCFCYHLNVQYSYGGYYMVAWRYEISLRVFNTRREISYLQATM